MRKLATFAAIALFAASTGAALADDDHSSVREKSQSRATAVDTLKQRIDALGYDVHSVEREDGVFVTRIVDRESKGMVKASFDAGSSELLRAAPGRDGRSR